jgi:hypothetical protein
MIIGGSTNSRAKPDHSLTPEPPLQSEDGFKQVSRYHDSLRAAAMKQCQRDAIEDIRQRPSSKTLVLEREGVHKLANLKPGMNVRIWKLISLVGSLRDRVLNAERPWDSTMATHLVAEIVPFNEDTASYTIGLQYDHDNMVKPQTSFIHLIAREAAQLETPDRSFDRKVQREKNVKGNGKFLELAATGLLTSEHIKRLSSLVTTSKKSKYMVKGETALYLLTENPIVTNYMKVASSKISDCPVNATFNCTSFLMYLFPDILMCRNLFMIADPTRCKALGVVDPSFAGCNKRGLTMSAKNVHADVMDQVMETATMAEKAEKAEMTKAAPKRRLALPGYPGSALKVRKIQSLPFTGSL